MSRWLRNRVLEGGQPPSWVCAGEAAPRRFGCVSGLTA